MSAAAALGAGSTSVAAAFCLATGERWWRDRRVHSGAWTISLAMFTVACAAFWFGAAEGWGAISFRAFYLFGAILNVPYLALGTIALLLGAEVGRRLRLPLDLASAFCAGYLSVVPLAHPLPGSGLPNGREVFGIGPRVLAGVFSGVAGTILIVGALWSGVTLWRSGRRPAAGARPTVPPTRLALTNALIAAGSLVLASGGGFLGSGDTMTAFALALLLGVSLLFAGFLVSSPAARPAPPMSPYCADLLARATR